MAIEDFVPGVDRFTGMLGRLVLKLVARSGKVDADAAGDMVERMRAAVPVDSGNLLNGISSRQEGGATIVEASAVRGDFDYARVVEFGRHADASYFEGGGEGFEAEPFFFPAVNDVLEERGQEMDDVIGVSAADVGLS